MYVELTPEDTLRDLQTLLLNSLPGFEFPRVPLLDNYTIDCTCDSENITTCKIPIIILPLYEKPEPSYRKNLYSGGGKNTSFGSVSPK